MNPLEVKNATPTTLAAMCQQEEMGYKTCPYLQQIIQSPQHHLMTTTTKETAATSSALDVDIQSRSNMVAWCYQVVDFCKFHRETVAISMNLLDRFMACPFAAVMAAKTNVKVYQLACMTTLYTAVKIHEPEAMDPKIVSTLSNGTYSPAQIEDMEMQILMALTWRVNPPTAMAFVRQFLDLLPAQHFFADSQRQRRDAVYDLAKLQTELAVAEYCFLGVSASVIAYCALLNALESVGMDAQALAYASAICSHAIGLHAGQDDDTVVQVQNWLYEAVLANQKPIDAFSAVSSSDDASSSSNSNAIINKHTSAILTSPRSTAQYTF
jgi:Cyclin, N-terminal domain/Cyclin, C-terminal domain